LSSFAIHPKFDGNEGIMILISVAAMMIIFPALLWSFVRSQIDTTKKHPKVLRIAIVVLVANIVLTAAIMLVSYLLNIDFPEAFSFSFIIAAGSVPFFVFVLLIVLAIEAFKCLFSKRQ